MAHYAAAASRAVSRLRHGLLILGAAGLSAFCAAVAAAPASAHGFGERYDLPLPLSLFVIAGAVVVALSFVIVAAFLPGGAGRGAYPRCNLLRIAPVRWLAAPWVTATLRTLSVALTVYVILGGLIGTERAALNPAPAAVYVAFWVGLSFFTALFGNLWALVNPWSAAWGFAENLADAVAPGRSLSRRLPWPARWGQWPAALVFAGFAILETVAAARRRAARAGLDTGRIYRVQLCRDVPLRAQCLAAPRRRVHGGVRIHGAVLHYRSARAAIGVRSMFQQRPLLGQRR